jgi:hypothetical protein
VDIPPVTFNIPSTKVKLLEDDIPLEVPSENKIPLSTGLFMAKLEVIGDPFNNKDPVISTDPVNSNLSDLITKLSAEEAVKAFEAQLDVPYRDPLNPSVANNEPVIDVFCN